MYSILIVDDEKMIREGIKKVIRWDKILISRIFTAVSAEQALSIIEEEEIDILLTDINMSKLSGLDLIDEINKKNPEIDILVITGYDNFEYAQKCLRMKVEDFFLKPVDEEVLTNAISKLTKKREKEKIEKKYQKVLTRKRGIEEQLNLEMTMRNLIHGNINDEKYKKFLSNYQYDYDKPMQVAIIVPTLYMNKNDDDNMFIILSIKNIAIGMFDYKGEGITFLDNHNRIILVLFENKEVGESIERLENLNNILVDEYEIKPKVVMGSIVEGFKNIDISYNEAINLLENRKFGETRIIQEHKTERRLDMFNQTFQELKSIMISNTANSDKVIKAFDTFEKACESYNLANSFVRRCCFEIASSIYFSYVIDSGQNAESELDSLLIAIGKAKREESFEYTRSFIKKLIEKDHNNHDIIESAKKYINKNIDKEITVSNIAEEMYLSENYFSRLFKKVTGEGCNKYIIKKRIERAKALLETTNLKTGKIAVLVGYRDSNYFSLAFKKYTGYSPTSYRNEKRKERIGNP